MTRLRFAIIITALSLALGLVIFYSTAFGSGFIRIYLADAIVVVFLYGLLSFTKLKPEKKVIGAIAIATGVELFQYFYTPKTTSAFQELIIGSTFDFKDIVLYIMGGLTVYIIDKQRVNKKEYEAKN